MDWPIFALITYVFLLVLLLTVLILRSLRDTKGRYQKFLEEKEQKLTAMQLDLEETLEALQAQATMLETQLSTAQHRSADTLVSVQNRLLEIQGVLTGLQGRVSRLENTQRQQADPASQAPNTAITTKEVQPIPIAPAQNTQQQAIPGLESFEMESPEGQVLVQDGEMGARGLDEQERPRRRALALLQSGMSVADVSRELGCSLTEVTLLFEQWRRGYIKNGIEEEPKT